MKKKLQKKIATLEVFEKNYKLAIEKIGIRDGFDKEFNVDNASILMEYFNYIERCLKKTNKVAVYHWETLKEQDGDNIFCFSDFDFAKAHYVRKHLSDANALEVYFVDKKSLNECKTEFARTLVPKSSLELVMSLDMSRAKDRPNYFEDIKFTDEEKEYQNTLNCSM